jgi:hypothetical protein
MLWAEERVGEGARGREGQAAAALHSAGLCCVGSQRLRGGRESAASRERGDRGKGVVGELL